MSTEPKVTLDINFVIEIFEQTLWYFPKLDSLAMGQ
jgi:hypothetical protein